MLLTGGRILIVKQIIAISFLVAVAYVLTAPATYYKLGKVVFGDVPEFYNVELAHYLFSYAAYPPIGTAPEFAHYQLSRTYFIRGQLIAAVKEAKKELELYPDNKRTYYILGLTYGYLELRQEAVLSFMQFIEAYPNSWAARNDIAWILFQSGDIAGARYYIEPVATVHNPWVQNTYGTILLNQGEYDKAKEAFLIAEREAAAMTEEEWGSAYPGNDPRIYGTGLSAMRRSIAANLALLEGLK